MGINKLELIDYNGDSNIVFGGQPLIENIETWPLIPGTSKKQTLLFTIFPSHFNIPTLTEDVCISVFISFESGKDFSNQFTYHSKSDFRKDTEYTTVLLHKKSENRLIVPQSEYLPLPLLSVREIPFTQIEFDADTEGVTRGSQVSKCGGQPGWLQDLVFLGPQYFFELQFNEYDLRKKSKEYDGIFNDGIGFLFLSHNTKKKSPPSRTGVFFIQYT